MNDNSSINFFNMNHEKILFCQDKKTGLKAIIAVHSTVCGPALGGTRMWKYSDDQSALTDVMRLSRGMTYKAAISGLNLGGGKAVIIGDPKKDKSEKEAKTPISEIREYSDGDNQTKPQKEKVQHMWPEKWVNDEDFPAWVNNQFSEKLITNLPKLKDWRNILVEKNSSLAVARLDVILTQKGITL